MPLVVVLAIVVVEAVVVVVVVVVAAAAAAAAAIHLSRGIFLVVAGSQQTPSRWPCRWMTSHSERYPLAHSHAPGQKAHRVASVAAATTTATTAMKNRAPKRMKTSEKMGPRVKVDTWFERVTGNKRKTDWTATADVMGALMHPQDMINGNASSIAAASGVVSSPQELGDKAVAIASMEKVYGVLDARGYGQVQQRHRHPGPAKPVAEPTPAQPMAHSEPLQVLLPHSSARSVLTEEAESSTVPEDQPEPQQTKSQIRDAKRKRLRDRTTGTKSEQDAEIERYGQWLDRKKKKKRKAEADAEG